MNYPDKNEQLVSLVVFLLSKGIISWTKCSQVMGISLVDLVYDYEDLVDPSDDLEKDLE